MTAKVHKTVQGIRKKLRHGSTRTYTIAGVLAFALIGMTLLVSSQAATPTAKFEAEDGTLGGNASVVSDSGASGSSAVKFAATGGGTVKPNASNTGVPAGTALTVVTGDQTYSTEGQVVSGLDIHGYVQITGKNITIKNSIIRGGTKPCTSSNAQNSAPLWIRDDLGATGAVIQDVEISPSNATACMDGIWASNVTLTRVNVHGSVDGIKAYDNVTLKDSYVHDLAVFASDPNQGGGQTHNDAIQSYECNANILVQHNNLDLSGLDANATYQITQDSGVRCSNIVIDSNWLDGGGCSINVAHKVLANLTGVSITNNRFGRHQGFSGCTVLLSTKSTLSAYSGNVWDDTGAAVPSPQVHD